MFFSFSSIAQSTQLSANKSTVCRNEVVRFTAFASQTPAIIYWYVNDSPYRAVPNPGINSFVDIPITSLHTNSTVKFLALFNPNTYIFSNEVTIQVLSPYSLNINGPTQLNRNTSYTFNIIPEFSTNHNYVWDIPSSFGTIQSGQNTNAITILTNSTLGNYNIAASAFLKQCTIQSAISSNYGVQIVNTPPTYPTNLNVSNVISGSSVRISFDPATDDTGINTTLLFYKPTASLGSYQSAGAATSSANYIDATGLTEGVEYTFSAISIDNNGYFSNGTFNPNPAMIPQNSSVKYTIDVTAPAPPTNLEEGEVTNTKVTLTWDEAVDNVKTVAYIVYLDGNMIANNVTRTMFLANITKTPNTFTVKAIDAKGNISDFSAPKIVNKVDPFTIDPITGNVGIGVKPASQKLDIDGNIRIRGNIYSNPLSITGQAGGVNRVHFEGSSLEFYTPVQAQWNGHKPILSMSQYGQIDFNSSPVLNYNALMLKGANDYNNGLKHADSFGATTGIGGPVVFGSTGGALGTSSNGHWETTGTNVALQWSANKNITAYGDLDVKGQLKQNGQEIKLIKTVNNYNTLEGNTNIKGLLKVGTNSLYLKGYNTPSDPTNEVYADGPLLIQSNVGNSNNTILNKNGGNIGIGILVPTAKLDVNGSLKSTSAVIGGLLQSTGQLLIGNSNPVFTSFLYNPTDYKLLVNGSVVVGGNVIATGFKTYSNLESFGNVTFTPLTTEKFTCEMQMDAIGGIKMGTRTITDWSEVGQWTNISGGITYAAGKVAIGTAPTNASLQDYKLAVNGRLYATRVTVPSSWADFVFEENYKLMDLAEVEKFIIKEKHLPNFPSAKQIQTEGLDTGEMIKLQMQKIEELTLHVIRQEKEIRLLKSKLH